jgi:hypothetical protein
MTIAIPRKGKAIYVLYVYMYVQSFQDLNIGT